MIKLQIQPLSTIGELMDYLSDGDIRQLVIPNDSNNSLARRIQNNSTDQSVKDPPSLTLLDDLMRNINKYYGKRLDDEVLLRAVGNIAESKGLPVRKVRKMTISEFNDALKEVLKYGPDGDQHLLWWNGEPHILTKIQWLFLKAVWSKKNVPSVHVEEQIYGYSKQSNGSLRTLISRVNAHLRELGIDVIFVTEKECVSHIDSQSHELLQ